MSLSQSSEINLTDNGKLALNAKRMAESAQSSANNAYDLANGAQRTADGKNSVYRGSDPNTVPATELKDGDIYFTDNALYTWNGSSWEETVSDTTGEKIRAKVDKAIEESQKDSEAIKEDIKNNVKRLDEEIQNTNIKTGNALNFYKEQYYLSTSYTELTGGSWSDDVPEKTEGKYVWSRYVTANVGDPTNQQYSDPVCISGLDGAQGPQGPSGPQGPQGVAGPKGTDGKTTYVHVAYANSADGKSNFDVDYFANALFVGVLTDYTETDSTDYTKYTWSRFKGDDGDQGVPGPKGENGQTTYVHFAYANSDDGRTDFNVNYFSNALYVGTYTDYNQTDSNDYTKYTWSRLKGDTGATGATGAQGPRGLQGLQGPKGDQGIQGATGATGPQGPQGTPSYTHIAYATSADGKSGFDVSNGEGKTYIGIYVDSDSEDSTNPTKYAWSLIKGADGAQGIQGPKGADGRTPYFHIAYANSSDGTVGFDVSNSVGKLYIGQYTDYAQTDSSDPKSYAWTKIKGETGQTGATGPQGPVGPQGPKGETGQVGPQGPQGVAGAKGSDGRTTYVHVAYANSADGKSNFSVNYFSNALYVGVLTDYTEADSTDYTKYTWSRLKGETGATGTQGPQGEAGADVYYSSYELSPNQQTMCLTDLSPVVSPTNLPKIGSHVIAPSGRVYAVTATYPNANPPQYGVGPQLTNLKGPVGPKGDTGAQGIQGPKGANGQTAFVHFAYANSADGKTNFNVSYFSNALYVGTYTDYTQTDSSDYTKYTWSRLKGDTGATGQTGATGPQGARGSDGTDAPTITVKSYTYSAANGDRADIELTGPNAFRQTVQSRGHNVWVLDAKTHKLKEFVNCDTYSTMSFNHNGTSTWFANYLAGLVDSIVVIASADADSVDQNLRNILNQMGGSPELGTWGAGRVGHAFIGMSKRSDGTWPLQPRQGYEEAVHTDGSAPEIGCALTNSGIVFNGAKGDQGATGATGPKGDKGDTGSTGFFIGNTPPPNPAAGTVWATADSSGNMTSAKKWNGSSWVSTAFTQDLVAGSISATKIVGGELDVNKITIKNAQNIPIESTVSLGDKLSSIEEDASQFKVTLQNKKNLIMNSGNPVNLDHWSTDSNTTLVKHPFWKNGEENLFYIGNQTTNEHLLYSDYFAIEPNTDYTLSFWAFNNNMVKDVNVFYLSRNAGSSNDWDSVQLLADRTIFPTDHAEYRTFTFNSGPYNTGMIRFDNNATKVVGNEAGLYIANIQLEKGKIATAWSNSDKDIGEIKATANSLDAYINGSQGSNTLKALLHMDPNNSSIAQLVNGNPVAAINLSKEGKVQIDGSHISLNSATTIPDATIKSGMIESLSADKLTAGTIDASQIRVINLDANNITTGTLSARINDLRKFETYVVSSSNVWDFNYTKSTYGNWFLIGETSADHVWNGPPGITPYMYVTSRGTKDANGSDRYVVTVWKDNDPTQYQRVWNGGYWSDWVRLTNSQNIVSSINLSKESVKISGEKVELDGNIELNGSTKVTGRLDLIQKGQDAVGQSSNYHNPWNWAHAHIYFDNYLQLQGENCGVIYTNTHTTLNGGKNFYSLATLTPGYLKFTTYQNKISDVGEDFSGQLTRTYLDSGRVETPDMFAGNFRLNGSKMLSQDDNSLYVTNSNGTNFDNHGDAGFQVWSGIGIGQQTIYTPGTDLYVQQGNVSPSGIRNPYSSAPKTNIHCNHVTSQSANTVSSRLSVKTDITKVTYDRALAAVEGTEMYDYRYTSDETGQHYVSGIIDDVNPDPQYHMDGMLINKERTARIDSNLLGYHQVVIQKLLERVDTLERKLNSK